MSYENNKQLVLEILYSMDTNIDLRNNEFQSYLTIYITIITIIEINSVMLQK